MAVEANVIVVFEDGTDNDSVTIEIDPTHENNIDDEGNVKSTFSPEDSPVFLVQHADDIQINSAKCTNGTIALIGENIGILKETDILLTALDDEVELSYIDTSFRALKQWFGNQASVFIENNTVKASSGVFPCYGILSFETVFDRRYKLTPPSLSLDEDETYTIYVVIYAKRIFS